ncbi:hypothetical protein MTO96_026328 [Rhipicephalus appendiculatus]
MVQVDIDDDGDTRFLSPWKACTGDEGRIMMRARVTRYTFQFRIVESTATGVKLEFDRLLPVTTQGVQIFVLGAGHGVSSVFETLSYLLPSFMEEVWNKEFFRNVDKAFQHDQRVKRAPPLPPHKKKKPINVTT